MTHQDIYTKFMIEYDKADVTSSYPSLTEYEIATFLDKAYLALIALKVTGNNVRRASLESDLKSIEDLSPLVVTDTINLSAANNFAENVMGGTLKEDQLYFLNASLTWSVPSTASESTNPGQNPNPPQSKVQMSETSTEETLVPKPKLPVDNKTTRRMPVKLVTHDMASGFFISAYNVPWIKNPVCFLENGKIYIVYDLLNAPNTLNCTITYIKRPLLFVKALNSDADQNVVKDNTTSSNFFLYALKENTSSANETKVEKLYTFECSDSMAEELISLAIIFALENVESSRLNAKLNTRGLEG